MTTAEGRFDPFFLQHVFFICITKPFFLLQFYLRKELFFSRRGSLTSQISRIGIVPAEQPCRSEMGPQRPNLTILDLSFLEKVHVQMDLGNDRLFSPHFYFVGCQGDFFPEASAFFQN